MNSFAYYSYEDFIGNGYNLCSQASDAAPLIVNCAGHFCSAFSFTTDNPSGRQDYYLMYVTAGQLTVRLDDGDHEVGAGEIVLFPPQYPYRYTYDGQGDPLHYFWVHFTGSHAAYFLHELGFAPLPGLWLPMTETLAMVNFQAMFDIFSKNDPFRSHALSAALQQTLLSLARSIHGSERKNPIIRSLRYINASYTTDISIPDLAAMENLSRSRYHTLFRSVTGTSPRQYITSLRLRHACELLRNTDLPVKQIAIIVGYSDPHFFTKLFKANIGVSPQQYRQG